MNIVMLIVNVLVVAFTTGACFRDNASYKSLHDQRQQFAHEDDQVRVSVRWSAVINGTIPAVLHPDKPASRLSVGDKEQVGFQLTHVQRGGTPLALRFNYEVSPPALRSFINIDGCFCDHIIDLKPSDSRALKLWLNVKPGLPLNHDIIQVTLKGELADAGQSALNKPADNQVDPAPAKL